MILTTHAIVGAAAASIFPANPVVAFAAAFASHFIVDALPHWDYPIRFDYVNPKVGGKFKFDKELILDAVTIGSDLIIGFALSYLIFGGTLLQEIILAGALGGILPDPLQFVSVRIRCEPFATLQRFHERIQEGKHVFKSRPIIGIVLQTIFVAAVALLANV